MIRPNVYLVEQVLAGCLPNYQVVPCCRVGRVDCDCCLVELDSYHLIDSVDCLDRQLREGCSAARAYCEYELVDRSARCYCVDQVD